MKQFAVAMIAAASIFLLGGLLDKKHSLANEGILVSQLLLEGNQYSPDIEALSGGGYVIAWQNENDLDLDDDGTSIMALVYDDAGAIVRSEFQVNTSSPDNQESPSIAALPNGDFVIVFRDAAGGIRARAFDATGQPRTTDDFLVSPTDSTSQFDARAAGLADSGYVIVWVATSSSGTSFDILARRYFADGSFVDRKINSIDAGNQENPRVTSRPDSGFIVTYRDESDRSGPRIWSRIYDSDANPETNDFLITDDPSLVPEFAAIDVLQNGNIVYIWESATRVSPTTSQLYGRIYDPLSNTQQQFGILTEQDGIRYQHLPEVLTLSERQFVVAWTDVSQTGTSFPGSLAAQVFDQSGNRVGEQYVGETFRTTQGLTQKRLYPELTKTIHGDILVTITDFDLKSSIDSNIYLYELFPNLHSLTLGAIAANGGVYLKWKFPEAGDSSVAAPVEGYNMYVRRGDFTENPLPVNKPGQPLPSLARSWLVEEYCSAPPCNVKFGIRNNATYRFTVRAIVNGIEGPDSNPVFVQPGEYAEGEAFAALPQPQYPILFLHGFNGRGRGGSGTRGRCTKGAFGNTLEFMSSTLGWRDGGHLFHEGASLGTSEDNECGFDPESGSVGFHPEGDFFTVDFGDRFAHYESEVPGGLSFQGDEVAAFVAHLIPQIALVREDLPRLSIVAHSNGGLAARSYMARYTNAARDIAALVTYGTPHRGADVLALLETAENLAIFDPITRTIPGNRLALAFGFRTFEDWLNVYANALINAQGGVDASFSGCDAIGEPKLSEFLVDLNARQIPSNNIDYTSIVGVDRSLFFLAGFGPISLLGNRSDDCLGKHWDGLVPTVSADLGEVVVKGEPVRLITTSEAHIGQGDDFSAILSALDPSALACKIMSPVDMEVVAPDGRWISADFTSIPGASYQEIEDEPGHTSATVLVPFPLRGDYEIRITPKADALPEDTYSMEVTVGGETVLSIEDQAIEEIPTEPFTVAALIAGDLDSDRDVDRDDLSVLFRDRNKPVEESVCGVACDLDGDGVITALDGRKLMLLCTRPRCLVE